MALPGYFSMSNRVNINFTVYGYLKMLTVLEAFDQGIMPPEQLRPDVHQLLKLFRSLPVMVEGAN